jgi:hypothetical protein
MSKSNSRQITMVVERITKAMQQPPKQHNESGPDPAVQLRAYELWEQRGRPWGTPDIDWFSAEQEIHRDAAEPPTITAAKAVGSVLGSVAGILSSVAEVFQSQ